MTFDEFDPRVIALPESAALQELAARAYQSPIDAKGGATALLEAFWKSGNPLASELTARGYTLAGYLAWNAKGKTAKPTGLLPVVASGSGRRNAADEAIARVRKVIAAADSEKPFAVWLHLPGPAGSSGAARKAAAKRAGIRLGWLLKDLEKAKIDEQTVVAVFGLPPAAGEPATGFVVEPGGTGSRGNASDLGPFVDRIRAALSKAR